MASKQHDGWLLYGATGFTGQRIAARAVELGIRPLLGGRSAARLRVVAEPLGLPWKAVSLDDAQGLERVLGDVAAVAHVAGPFRETAAPMQEACLRTRTHYLDITGELDVIAATFERDGLAREAGITLVPACGFDVVPTDLVAHLLHEHLPDAARLLLVIDAVSRPSAGTAKSALGVFARGGARRRDGVLESVPLVHEIIEVRRQGRMRTAVSVPLGDLITAWHTTGIPNITTYAVQSPALARRLHRWGKWLPRLLRLPGVRALLEALFDRWARGPDDRTWTEGTSWVYGEVAAPDGRTLTAELETEDAYRLTANLVPHLAARLTRGEAPPGVHSPLRAFAPAVVVSACERCRIRLDGRPWSPEESTAS